VYGFRSLAASWQDGRLALDLDGHCGIDQREKTMPGTHREPWLFPVFDATKERTHSSIQANIDLCQQLAIHLIQIGIMVLAFLQRHYGFPPPGPLLPLFERHDPPIVQATTRALHTFQGRGILRPDVQLDLCAQQHP
jgi:hypothetical protein